MTPSRPHPDDDRPSADDAAVPPLALVPPRPDISPWRQPRDADDAYVALPRRDLPALTSLRFFAAIYVVVHHLVNIGLLQTQGADADRTATWYLAWATQGHVGVTFFFVLSGFILAWCYHRAFSTPDPVVRSATRSKFWIARFARVWPLHGVVFLLFVPLAVLDSGVRLGALSIMALKGLLNVTLLHAWIPFGGPEGLAETFNAPSWTLSVEMLFYALFPAIAALLVWRLRWGVAQLALLAAGSWAVLGAAAALLANAPHGEWIMRVFPPSRLPDFVIGVALGLFVVQGLQKRVLRDQPQSPDRAGAGWTLLEAAAIAAACLSPLVWALAAADHLPDTLGTSWFHLPAIAACIFVLSLERGAISRRVLAAGWLVWLGEISYALYLTHLFIVLGAYRAGLYDRIGAWPASLLVAAVAIAVAGVVHERFEKPVRASIVARMRPRT